MGRNPYPITRHELLHATNAKVKGTDKRLNRLNICLGEAITEFLAEVASKDDFVSSGYKSGVLAIAHLLRENIVTIEQVLDLQFKGDPSFIETVNNIYGLGSVEQFFPLVGPDDKIGKAMSEGYTKLLEVTTSGPGKQTKKRLSI